MKILKISHINSQHKQEEFLNKIFSTETKSKIQSLIQKIDSKYESQELDSELDFLEMELENILELEDDYDADLEREIIEEDYMDSDSSQGGMLDDIIYRFTHYVNRNQEWSLYHDRENSFQEFIKAIRDILLMAGAKNVQNYSDKYIYELAEDIYNNQPKHI